METNQYVMEGDEDGNILSNSRGKNWKPLTVLELKAFFGIQFYIGLQKQPSKKSYWLQDNSIFHCSLITKLISRNWFMELRCCLHLIDGATYVKDWNAVEYDKMGQVHRLIEKV